MSKNLTGVLLRLQKDEIAMPSPLKIVADIRHRRIYQYMQGFQTYIKSTWCILNTGLVQQGMLQNQICYHCYLFPNEIMCV